MAEEVEDENLRMFKDLEQQCLAKQSRQKRKKYKKYLGPDSADIIPPRSKYRLRVAGNEDTENFSVQQKCEEMRVAACSQTTQEIVSGFDQSLSSSDHWVITPSIDLGTSTSITTDPKQSNSGNDEASHRHQYSEEITAAASSSLSAQANVVAYLSAEHNVTAPINFYPHQAIFGCDQRILHSYQADLSPESDLGASTSTSAVSKQFISENGEASSYLYYEQISTAGSSSHSAQENQVHVAYLSVEHNVPQIDLQQLPVVPGCCDQPILPSYQQALIPEIVLGASTIPIPVTRASVMQEDCAAMDLTTHRRSETEETSESENSPVQSIHRSRSRSRTTSSSSRSQSASSLSLNDSDSEVSEHEEHQEPINGQVADVVDERGGDQGEQAPADQRAPADGQGGGEGENRGVQQGEQQGGEAAREHEQHNNEDAGRAEPREREPTHAKLREAMLGGFLNNVELPVQASRNDILYMALSFSSKNNETNTAFCNLINFINCVFVSPVLPTTQYLLDNLLKSDVGVHYHFYCKKCFKSFGELDYKNIRLQNCEICETENHISDLRLSTFFVMFDLPVQLEILFSKPELVEALSTPTEALAKSRAGFLSDIYDGSAYEEFCAATVNFQERIMSMHLSVDGSPIAKSSSASIWPIQGEIHELTPNMRMKNLLLCGLWFGKSQPKMDLFLRPFVSHMRTLGQGFQLQAGPTIWNTKLYCIGCCVDSGARGSVQGIKTHGGYFSCNWCKICGTYIAGAVRYPITDQRPDVRAHDELVILQRRLLDVRVARADPLPEEDEEDEENNDQNGPRNADMLGVNAVSPLINMPLFDMVNSFFVENMHCVDMGIVKWQISIWLDEAGMPYCIKGRLQELNRRISALRPPLEFRRMPRILKERLNFKAREYNNFLWYCYIILVGILPNRYLNIWVLFIQAIFLLSQAEVSIEHINIAEALIIHFLEAVQREYGQKNMSFNLHIVRHLAAHVRRWGPLWASSAYVFEDGNGHLKNLIHTVECVPHQVVRHWSWDLARSILHPHVSEKARSYAASINKPKHQNKKSYRTETCRLIGTPKPVNLSEEEMFLCQENDQGLENLQSFEKIIYKNCAYVVESKRSVRTSNTVAQLTDKTVVLIRKIVYDTENDNVFLFVSNIQWEPILTLPRGLQMNRDDHCLREVTFVNEELRLIKCTDLKIICFRTHLPHADLLSVLPNVQNRE